MVKVSGLGAVLGSELVAIGSGKRVVEGLVPGPGGDAFIRSTGQSRRPSVQLESPSLHTILMTGTDVEAGQLLGQFPSFREMPQKERRSFLTLWRFHNSEAKDPDNWRSHPNWLSNPLALPSAAADMAGILPASQLFRSLSQLDLHVRASLAREQALEFPFPGRKTPRKVRITLLNNGLPVRDGTIPIHLDRVDGALAHFEAVTELNGAFPREEYRQRLIFLEAVRGYEKLREPHTQRGPWGRAGYFYPDLDSDIRSRLALLQAVIVQREGAKRGDEFFAGLPERPRFYDLVRAAAEGFEMPAYYLMEGLYGRKRPFGIMGIGFEGLPDVLKLLNLVSVERPEEVIYRLHRDLLDWGFAVRRNREGRLIFGIGQPLPAYDDLKRGGVGIPMSAARYGRGVRNEDLAREVSARLAERERPRISSARLGQIMRNEQRPDPDQLRAIVETLNQMSEGERIDPAGLLLAAEPSYFGLLTLAGAAARGSRAVFSVPIGGVRRMVPYEPTPLSTTHLREGSRNLDREGLAFLVQRYRLQSGFVSIRAASQRLAPWKIGGSYLYRLERDYSGTGQSVPGRNVVLALSAPEGFGAPLVEVLAAHMHSCWRDDPEVQRLVARGGFGEGPVLITQDSRQRLRQYESYDFPTPMEFLYGLRNGPGLRNDRRNGTNGTISFPATEADFAKYLGVEPQLYAQWERGTAVPSDGEIDIISKRAGFSPERTAAFKEAAVRMRKAQVAAVSLPTELPEWIARETGLSHFLRLVAIRRAGYQVIAGKLGEKLEELNRLDPSSVRFIARVGRRLADPSSHEVRNLIDAVRFSIIRLKAWPASIRREGPVAALYYHAAHEPARVAELDRALEHPKVHGVAIDPQRGTISYDRESEEPAYFPARYFRRNVVSAAVIHKDEIDFLSTLFDWLRKTKAYSTKDRFNKLAQKIDLLATEDSLSYRDLMARLVEAERPGGNWREEGWVRIRETLQSACDFVENWAASGGAARVTWDGSLFDFYYQNHGDRAALMRFSNTVANGNVTHLVFRGGSVEYTRVNRGRKTKMAGTSYSYRDATELKFVPNPANGWGSDDLTRPVAWHQKRISAFFDRIERRQRMTSADMMRHLGVARHYYRMRDGHSIIMARDLSDGFLDRMGLAEAEREELRHYEAALAVAKDRAVNQESMVPVERGPYEWPAVLWRYFRYLHATPLMAVRRVIRGESGIETHSEVELGRVAILDPAKIARMAQAVGVPRIAQNQFVQEVSSAYRATYESRCSTPSEGLTEFPNASWEVPFGGLTLGAMKRELTGYLRGIQGEMDDQTFKEATGLTAAEFYSIRRRAQLGEAPLGKVLGFLRRQQRGDEAWGLRVRRAALYLKYNPIPDRTAWHRPAQLLRFLRYLLPGTPTVEALAARTRHRFSATNHTRWEWGFVDVPPRPLRLLVEFYVGKIDRLDGRQEEIITRMNRLYERTGGRGDADTPL